MPVSRRHLTEILVRTGARYLTVLAEGFQLQPGEQVLPHLDVHLVSFGDARTLYRGRRPICRSLDGLGSVSDARRQCPTCPDRKYCTPQIRVELLHDEEPWRLLLAYTSATNIVRYLALLNARRLDPAGVCTRLQVQTHGTWGEVLFAYRPQRTHPGTTPPPGEAHQLPRP